MQPYQTIHNASDFRKTVYLFNVLRFFEIKEKYSGYCSPKYIL